MTEERNTAEFEYYMSSAWETLSFMDSWGKKAKIDIFLTEAGTACTKCFAILHQYNGKIIQ